MSLSVWTAGVDVGVGEGTAVVVSAPARVSATAGPGDPSTRDSATSPTVTSTTAAATAMRAPVALLSVRGMCHRMHSPDARDTTNSELDADRPTGWLGVFPRIPA